MTPLCILIVDDDHDTRVALRDSLEELDFCVCSAANGKDALDMLTSEKCHPSLIFLDLMMPVMNGWDFLSAIDASTAYRTIPIVITSASKNQNTVDPTREFLPKPLDLPSLKKVVAKYLKSA